MLRAVDQLGLLIVVVDQPVEMPECQQHEYDERPQYQQCPHGVVHQPGERQRVEYDGRIEVYQQHVRKVLAVEGLEG